MTGSERPKRLAWKAAAGTGQARLAALLGAMLLAGCGTMNGGSTFGPVVRGLLPDAVADVLPGDAPAVGPEARAATTSGAGFAAENIAADPDAFRTFEMRSVGIAGLGRLGGRNGNEVTWLGQTGYSATFEDGVLVATRGLGEDLMAADVTAVRAALAQGGGQARRVHEVLDSRDRIVRRSYDCTIAATGIETVQLATREVQALRFEEDCTGQRVAFQNIYWFDGPGSIVQSRQFVSPTVAYLRIGEL